MATNSTDLINVRVRLNQIVGDGGGGSGSFSAPTGMGLSFETNNVTVAPGSVSKEGFTYKLLTPMVKNMSLPWAEGTGAGGMLDSVDIAAWENPQMTGNLIPAGYVAGATSDTNNAYLVCDKKNTTFWKSTAVPTKQAPQVWQLLFPAAHKLDYFTLTLNENAPAYLNIYVTQDSGITWKNIAFVTNEKDNVLQSIVIDNPQKTLLINGVMLEVTSVVNPLATGVSLYELQIKEYIDLVNVFVMSNGVVVDVAASIKDTPVIPAVYSLYAKIGSFTRRNGQLVSVWPTEDLATTFLDNNTNDALALKADKLAVSEQFFTKVDKVVGKSLLADTEIAKLLNLVNVVDLGTQVDLLFLDMQLATGFYGFNLVPSAGISQHKYLLVDTNAAGETLQVVYDGLTAKNRVYTPGVAPTPGTWSAFTENKMVTPAFIKDMQDQLALKADKTALQAHVTDKANPHTVTKTQVGLSNVDNTSDILKPVSTAVQNALDAQSLVIQEKIPLTQKGSANGVATLDVNAKVPLTQLENAVPAQATHTGKYLSTNGTTTSWSKVVALPEQAGQTGKYLTTNGTLASWDKVEALPVQAGQTGKYLTTDGTLASWATVSDPSVLAALKAINGASVWPRDYVIQNVTQHSGTIQLQSDNMYIASITGLTYIQLPTVVDKLIRNQIELQFTVTAGATIDWGTNVLWINGEAPIITSGGFYRAIFEYDNTALKWSAGAVRNQEPI